jgi:hypothetical protein
VVYLALDDPSHFSRTAIDDIAARLEPCATAWVDASHDDGARVVVVGPPELKTLLGHVDNLQLEPDLYSVRKQFELAGRLLRQGDSVELVRLRFT